ncbi:hypothetical protein [Anatilimnocola floriformis]|uniref:hypothetical protein n=1 Tax=Anatilimnocola floriformis TaxID=2948575 RepID=UPI0020C53AA7|nr:hypothetical protein [Anatilimnocola floriformis]
MNFKFLSAIVVLITICIGSFTATKACAQADKVAALEAALGETTVAEFVETPLVDVCDFFRDMHGLQPIEIDKPALKELGLADNPAITVCIQQSLPLYAGMRLILEGLSADLVAVPKDDRLVITSAPKSWCTVRYDVHDLVAAAAKGRAAASKPEAEVLRDLIANTVSSSSWKDGGGKGTIAVDKDVLVVQNFARQQWEVRDLLSLLRKELTAEKEPNLKTVGDKVRSAAQRIFSRGDTNVDGLISGPELEGYKGFDRDQNQQVTLEECIQYVRDMKIAHDRRK